MNDEEIQYVESQISYTFNNKDLLVQAFVRKSYSYEHGGQNNEVLEFIGDSVLDLIVVKILSDRYGGIDEDEEYQEYENDYSEGQLTEIKKKLVQKSNLAQRIRLFGFEDCLIMGTSDQKQNVQNSESVQEDLFEAIIGAVTIDSDWNMKELQDVVEIMLDTESELDEDQNYVQLIQDWTLRDRGSLPEYEYIKQAHPINWALSYHSKDPLCADYRCRLTISNHTRMFEGFGMSKSEARKEACEKAYHFLEENDMLYTIRDEIDEPTRDMAINQLEILARRGYFSIPQYSFSEALSSKGNPVWKCKCEIGEAERYFTGSSSSKKEAKKQAAFRMLNYVLDHF